MLGSLLKWFLVDTDKSGNKKIGVKDLLPKLSPLYEGNRGIHDLRLDHAVLRIWLPVPVKTAMDECMEAMHTSAAEYLREFLVVYLYGSHELLRMQADQTGLYYVQPPSSTATSTYEGAAMFSRAPSVECIPGLGKNIIPIKLYLNKKMKDDLGDLAKNTGIPLGQLVREVLVSHFLGHTVWPERKLVWTADQKRIAEDWVDGKIEAHTVIWRTPAERDALEGKVVPI